MGAAVVTVFGGDGQRWRLGRRRIAFRPRRLSLGGFLEAVDEPAAIIFVAVFWVLIYVPVVYVCAWIIALCWTPVIMLLRTLRLARAKIVAYPLGLRHRDFPGTWAAVVPVGEAQQTLKRAEWELRTHGRPLSLKFSAANRD